MSDTNSKFVEALVRVQASGLTAKMDRENPFFKSRYATLASVWDTIRTPLEQNGLAVLQHPSVRDDGTVMVTTELVHVSGEHRVSTVCAKPVKQDVQTIGSTITYLRRYGLCAMLGVVADADDDGNASVSVPMPDTQQHQRIAARIDLPPEV